VGWEGEGEREECRGSGREGTMEECLQVSLEGAREELIFFCIFLLNIYFYFHIFLNIFIFREMGELWR
jgi:hypothetical protein